jgi:hypothetical protein
VSERRARLVALRATPPARSAAGLPTALLTRDSCGRRPPLAPGGASGDLPAGRGFRGRARGNRACVLVPLLVVIGSLGGAAFSLAYALAHR